MSPGTNSLQPPPLMCDGLGEPRRHFFEFRLNWPGPSSVPKCSEKSFLANMRTPSLWRETVSRRQERGTCPDRVWQARLFVIRAMKNPFPMRSRWRRRVRIGSRILPAPRLGWQLRRVKSVK